MMDSVYEIMTLFLKRMILFCWHHLPKLENLFEKASEKDVSVASWLIIPFFDKAKKDLSRL